MAITYTHHIYVVHEYTALVTSNKWGVPEERMNNRREIPADPGDPSKPDQSSVDHYVALFGSRLGDDTTDVQFGHYFEGIYGYRWKNLRIEIATTEVRVDITQVIL